MAIHTVVLLRAMAITNKIRQAEFTLTIWRLDDDDDDDDRDLDDLDKKKNKKEEKWECVVRNRTFFARKKNFTALKCRLQ